MKKASRNQLKKLRSLPAAKRTPGQIRRLIALAHQEAFENRTHDPIRPREKKP